MDLRVEACEPQLDGFGSDEIDCAINFTRGLPVCR